jgi:hypothetical protein
MRTHADTEPYLCQTCMLMPAVNSPMSFTMLPIVEPLIAFSLDTMLSAGCETTAQKTPAM